MGPCNKLYGLDCIPFLWNIYRERQSCYCYIWGKAVKVETYTFYTRKQVYTITDKALQNHKTKLDINKRLINFFLCMASALDVNWQWIEPTHCDQIFLFLKSWILMEKWNTPFVKRYFFHHIFKLFIHNFLVCIVFNGQLGYGKHKNLFVRPSGGLWLCFKNWSKDWSLRKYAIWLKS